MNKLFYLIKKLFNLKFLKLIIYKDNYIKYIELKLSKVDNYIKNLSLFNYIM